MLELLLTRILSIQLLFILVGCLGIRLATGCVSPSTKEFPAPWIKAKHI